MVSSGKVSALGPDGEYLWDVESRANWREKYITPNPKLVLIQKLILLFSVLPSSIAVTILY